MNRSAEALVPVVIDVETTGFGRNDRIVEIAVIALDPMTWETVDEYDTLINPERDVGPTGVHGITASMVEAAPTFKEILVAVADRMRGAVLIAHNLAFDTRMLRYEFERRGVPIDLGIGLCTYRATRKRLVFACEEHEISLSQQHRALADARATAELARHLHLAEQARSSTMVEIGEVPQTSSGHTLRRGLADAGTSPMHRVVSRASIPQCDSIVQQYLDMLDWVLDDGVIDARERSEMELLARELGISEKAQEDAHRAYLDCIISAAQRDGIISAAEHQLIVRIAGELDIHDPTIPEITPVLVFDAIPPGGRICFTGAVNKEQLGRIAERAGFQPVRYITKKGCDVLVAADAATGSSKAGSARKWGIPIISATEFVEQCKGSESRRRFS